MNNSLRVGYLITGRLKSTRLPKKLLLEVQGKPIIEHMIDRLKLSKYVGEIVICTSDNEQDLPLVDVAINNGIQCYQGDPQDVLARLLGAADKYNFDYILNITADCPFVDPDYADKIVNEYQQTGADLIRQFDLPHGVFSYGIKVEALRKVVEIKESSDTEVWGRYFTDTGLFSVTDLDVKNQHHKRPGLRMTLDYPEDFEFFKTIFDVLYEKGKVFSLDQILNFLDENPEVIEINKACGAKFSKRFLMQSELLLKKIYEVRTALIVGSGSIGQRHIRNLRHTGIDRIVALRSKKGHFKSLPKELGIEEVYEWSELENQQFDIAIISNPSSLHLAAVEKIVNKAKGVFIEKPLSDTLQSSKDVVDLIQSNKLVSFVGHNMMFHPAVRKMFEFYNENEVGEIVNFQCQVGQWLPDWHPYEDYKKAYYARKDLGGGVSLTMIHEIHLALQLAGEPVEVYGMLSDNQHLDLDVDVCSDVMVRHRKGAVSQIHLDYLQRPPHRSGLLTFECGWISYDLNNMTVYGQTEKDKQPKLIWQDSTYDANEMYVEQMREFVRFTEEGRLKHKYDVASSIDSLQVVDALFSASHTGRAVRLDREKRFSFFS